MQARDPLMAVVGGISYSQKLQELSLPSGQCSAQSGDKLLALHPATPREGQHDLKQSSFNRQTIISGNQPKQETRVSQQVQITAINNTLMMPKVVSENGRNNILSSSLQVLNVPAASGRMNARNGSAVVNDNQQLSNPGNLGSKISSNGYDPTTANQQPLRVLNILPSQPIPPADSSKGLHLRYVSQGMQRSTSIDQTYLNSRTTVPSASRKVNLTTHTSKGDHLQKQQELAMPAQTITERVQTQQIQEKKVLSSTVVASQNQRRLGASSNNVITGLTSVQNSDHITSEMKVQRSLKVQSNQSSIAIDALNGKKTKQPTKFAQSMAVQYGGVLSSKQESGLTAASEQKNVPLIVNSRKNINDCLLAGQGTGTNSQKNSQIIKGVQGLGASTTSTQESPSKKRLGPEILTIVKPITQVGGRKDRVQSYKKKTMSNQSFQSIHRSIIQDNQMNQQNLERALKTAQMGFSQRTRGSMIDSANVNNVWDAPLSQKLDATGAELIQSRHSQQNNMSVKTREQLILLHNVTPGQARKPDFRQSTALPKSYKQFVATVNSGHLQQSQNKTTTGNFINYTEQTQRSDPKVLIKEVIQTTRQNASSKRGRKSKKDDIIKMINKLEMGENSETFRNLAKQFYLQNVQQVKPTGRNSKQSPVVSTDGTSTKEMNSSFPIRAQQHQISTQAANQENGKGAEEGYVKLLQKQLWQQFQLLRILKQTKYQQQLEKCQRRGDSGLPVSGPPGSQSVEYGFEMTEEEMYKMLFLNQENGSGRKAKKVGSSSPNEKEDNQPYASFDCPECVQMASLMLEEELRFYQQRHFGGKKKGKSRDALHRREAGLAMVKGAGVGGHQPLKGIAGLQTQGVSLKNQRLSEDDQLMLLRELQDSAQGKKSKRGQTQQYLAGKRMQTTQNNNFDDPQVIGQMLVSRCPNPPSVIYKKQMSGHGFRQVVRGEQMTHYSKGQMQFCPPQNLTTQQLNANVVCSCRSGPYQQSGRGGRGCICGANNLIAQVQPIARSQYQAPAIPSMNYGGHLAQAHQATRGHKQRKGGHGKGHGHSGQGQDATANGHPQFGHGQEPKNALDGTVAGHKRKFKPANGIYQPPLQPFKHLAQSPINQVISKANELVLILFKQRMKCSDQQFIKLFKYFGIPIPRGNGVVLDTKAIRMPDFQHAVNQKLLLKLYKVLNNENGGIQPEQSTQIFRFYVGKGNNYPSVRQIISKRTWWNRGNQKQEKFYGQKAQDGEEFLPSGANAVSASLEEQMMNSSSKQFSSGCHFIWTQWRKTEHHEFLRRVDIDKQKVKIDGQSKKSPRKVLGMNMQANAPLANIPTLIYNRLDDNYHLSNKKALFLNVSNYYRAMGINPFEVAIPLTFNVKSSNNTDPEYIKFTRAYKSYEQQNDANIWIIKPGENSNQGNGIQVASSLGEIRNIIQSSSSKSGNRSTIVQKYLDKPLLIHNRKFDIRGYALITSVNGKLKGYMYRDCYFRTSSKQFDLTNLHSRLVHLTNDAIQINSEDYGRYESGNKLSINDFQRFLDQSHGSKNVCFMRDLFPQMERLVTDSFRAVGSRIDPKRLSNCFEIFGYDFMIDENFKVFLIEANTNPSLEICSPLLARIVPELLDNSFRIAIDPLYQPGQLLAKLKDEAGDNWAGGSAVRDRGVSYPDVKIEKSKVKGAAVECGDVAALQQSPVMNKRIKEAASASIGAAAQPAGLNSGALKRQRLEMLTQIKYTLIYDERIDKPVVDKILAEYELKLQNINKAKEIIQNPAQGEVIVDEPNSPTAQAQPQVALLKEIVEEEKLDELQAKKEEIEAAENEEAGILPQPLMLQPLTSQQVSDDEDEDDLDSDDGN